ncbi:COG1470 family protein [Sinomicrobium sp. M5D2P17]
MFVCTKRWFYLLCSTFIFTCLLPQTISAQGLSLYTPYTRISVPPGETIDYSVDIINNTGSVRTSSIKISGLPEEWDYELKSGGYSIEEIAVLPGQKKTLSFTLHVPFKIDKGTYNFHLTAPGYTSLPLAVTISRQGTSQARFSSKQTNIEGAANSTFTYNAELRNGSGESEAYALRAMAQRGWNVIYKVNGKQVSSVNVEPNQTQRVTIEVHPPAEVKAGTYKIPVTASSGTISARLELESVITGTYDLALTTPTGLLSTQITAGDQKKIKLLLKNTGSAAINNLELKSKKPANWDVSFEPAKVNNLAPGKTEEIYATISVDDKALAGDYVTELQATSTEARSEAAFRISVKNSVLAGWAGIFVILAALGSVYALIRKYGRR